MRIHYTGLAAIALLLGVCAFLSSSAAQAGDEATQPAGGQVYDVRIVRVATPTPEGVEQPCPFLTGDATTISTDWPAILATLKKRGATTVLMDQRVTSTGSVLAKISEERQMPTLAIQSKTLTGENHAAARIRSGCNVEVRCGDDGSLLYRVMVRGALRATSDAASGATESLNSWEGNHVHLRGRTLVLSHRAQQMDPGDKNARGVELYCFVHGRAAAR